LFQFIWRGRKDDKRNIISQTEFIVHDKENPTDEDFLVSRSCVFKCKSGSELFLISDISLVSIVSGSILLSTLTIKKLSKKIDDLSSAHDVQCRKLQSDFNLKEDKILKKLEEANKDFIILF
jgi:hypothetical protein